MTGYATNMTGGSLAIHYDEEDLASHVSGSTQDSGFGESQKEAQRVHSFNDLDDLTLHQLKWLGEPSDRHIVHPNCMTRLAWDFFALVFILAECVTLPLALCFFMYLPDQWHMVSTAFFAADIFVNFNTGYFHGTVLIMKRRWLSTHYARTWLIIDVVSTIPWDLLVSLVSGDTDSDGGGGAPLLRVLKLGKLARVLRLLKLAKVTAMLKRLQSMALLGHTGKRHMTFMMSVAKMLLVLIMLCHWAACAWGWIGDPVNLGHGSWTLHDLSGCTMGGPCEPGVLGSPWRRRYGLENQGLLTQYLAALQFAAGLLVGGESVLQPGTDVERVFSVLTMLFGVVACSIILSQILLIMNRQSEASLVFDEQVQQVQEFMHARRIAPELQAKIHRHLEGVWKARCGSRAICREFMDHLSPWLRVELTEHLNSSVLRRHPFFRHLPTEIMRWICNEASPVLYSRGDVVVEKGQSALCAYFITSGKLCVIRALGPHNVYLRAPSWFGDRCLFSETRRTHTVTAVTPSELLCIERAGLASVCSQFPVLDAAYQAFRSQVSAGDDSCMLCGLCGMPGHSVADCPSRCTPTVSPKLEPRSWTRLVTQMTRLTRRQC